MNEDMDETQSPNPWPTGDVTPERFSLEVNEDQSVSVLDGETRLFRYVGTGAMAEAVRRCMELKRREALGLDPLAYAGNITPAKFLTETLPRAARQQRLEGMLAEVRTAEASALAGLTDAITLLNRAVSLRERLEKALETAVRPLSATESAERAPGVGRVTQTATARTTHHGEGRITIDFNSAGIEPNWAEITTYKPQPY